MCSRKNLLSYFFITFLFLFSSLGFCFQVKAEETETQNTQESSQTTEESSQPKTNIGSALRSKYLHNSWQETVETFPDGKKAVSITSNDIAELAKNYSVNDQAITNAILEALGRSLIDNFSQIDEEFIAKLIKEINSLSSNGPIIEIKVTCNDKGAWNHDENSTEINCEYSYNQVAPINQKPSHGKCTWGVNNCVPTSVDISKYGFKECDAKAEDGTPCGEDNAACIAPAKETEPLTDGLVDSNLKAVKTFTCRCGVPREWFSPTLDFQRYLIPNENLPECKHFNYCEEDEIGVTCASQGGKGLLGLGRKVYKCNGHPKYCSLHFSGIVSEESSLPICPADSTGNVNNTVCSEEGFTCRKKEVEPWTLSDLKKGSRKLLRCDCRKKQTNSSSK